MSAPLFTSCPRCNHAIINDASMAGQVVACPGCGGQVRLPAAADEPPDAAPAAEDDNPYRSPAAALGTGPAGYGGYPSVLGRRRECSDAGTALTLAIVGIFCAGIILHPIALYLAISAHRKIARHPQLTGSGKATAALVISVIFLGLTLLAFALQILLILAE